MLQNFFPGIHSLKVLILGGLQAQLAPEESEKSPRQLFPQLWKNRGKHTRKSLLRLHSVSGLTP
jgi:hypothetical protein